MSLNDIQLPGSLIASLYARSLVITESMTVEEGLMVTEKEILPDSFQKPVIAEKKTVAEPGFKFLGDNKKQILIIVHYPSIPHLPDEELSFLTRMLDACKLSLADVAILNLEHYPGTNAKEIHRFLKPAIVFLFGTEPAAYGLPVNFPAYQVQLLDQVTYLYTPTLGEQQADPLLKSKLWVSLKRIFGI